MIILWYDMMNKYYAFNCYVFGIIMGNGEPKRHNQQDWENLQRVLTGDYIYYLLVCGFAKS